MTEKIWKSITKIFAQNVDVWLTLEQRQWKSLSGELLEFQKNMEAKR